MPALDLADLKAQRKRARRESAEPAQDQAARSSTGTNSEKSYLQWPYIVNIQGTDFSESQSRRHGRGCRRFARPPAGKKSLKTKMSTKKLLALNTLLSGPTMLAQVQQQLLKKWGGEMSVCTCVQLLLMRVRVNLSLSLTRAQVGHGRDWLGMREIERH